MKIGLNYHIHIDLIKNTMHMKLNQFRVRVRFHLHLDRTDVVVRAECPEVRILHAVDTVDLPYPLVGGRQLLFQLDWRTLHQNGTGTLQQRNHAKCDKCGYENRTDRIGNHPAELTHQNRRDDYTHTAQRIGQNVQKDTVHDLTVRAAGRSGRMVVVMICRHRTAVAVQIGLR